MHVHDDKTRSIFGQDINTGYLRQCTPKESPAVRLCLKRRKKRWMLLLLHLRQFPGLQRFRFARFP